MSCQNYNLTIALFVAVTVLLPNQSTVKAQDSKVNFHEEPRITGDLLTRGELKRLITHSTSGNNPLRQSRDSSPPLERIIRDTSVSPATWQEPSFPSAPGSLLNQDPHSTDAEVPKVDKITTPKLNAENPTPAVQTTISDASETPEIFGPMPWEELVNSWQKWNLMTEGSVEDIEVEINQRQQEIESGPGIDVQADERRLRQLQMAREAVNKAKQSLAKKEEYGQKIKNFPNMITTLREKAKQPIEPRPVDSSLPINAMQSRLDQLQSELEHSNTQLLKAQEQIQNRDTRMGLIPTEILSAREKANELHNQILQKQAEGADSLIEVLVLRAQEIEANSEVQLREEEERWHELSFEALPLDKAIFNRLVQSLEKAISQWNDAIKRRRQHELEEQVRIARQKAIDAHPSLKELLEKTTNVAQSRQELAAKISALEDEKLKVSQQLSKVDTQHQNLEQSLANGGKDESRTELVEVHRNLIRPYEGMARVQKLKYELQQSKASIRQLRNEQEQVADSATYIRQSLHISDDEVVHQSGTSLFTMAEEAVSLHSEQLNNFIKDSEGYRGLLEGVLTNRKSLQEKIAVTRDLVDTNMLWVQSADPIGIDVLHDSSEGAREFFDLVEWARLGDSVVTRVRQRPYESATGIFGLIAAFVVGRKFRG